MESKQKRGSRELMHDLTCGDDLEAVNTALEAGAITERQAKNAIEFIESARDIRENPIRTVVVQDKNGVPAGEADPLPDGRWQARCYGPRYRTDEATLCDTEEEAVRFILSTWVERSSREAGSAGAGE